MKHFVKKIGAGIVFLLMASMSDAHSASCEEIELCSPCCRQSCGTGFIEADLLYWRVYENGLDVCIPTDTYDTIDSDGRVTTRLSGRGKDPRFEWNPGFRIGAGYTFPCDLWTFAAYWTHFHTHAHRHQRHGNRAHLDIRFDVVDVVSIYEARLSPRFALRPFFGLRGAKIDQKLHSKTDSSYSSDSSSGYGTGRLHNKQEFSGIGPVIGLEADWTVGCGFSVYAEASVSWLYGKFRVKLNETNKLAYAYDYFRQKKHLDTNIWVVDAGFGIRRSMCFCGDKQILLQLGLEHHRYFDYNRLGGCGDLSFDGLTFSVGTEF